MMAIAFCVSPSFFVGALCYFVGGASLLVYFFFSHVSK